MPQRRQCIKVVQRFGSLTVAHFFLIVICPKFMRFSSAKGEHTAQSVALMAAGLWRTMRPHQWFKNIFVFAPLFFSKSFVDPRLCIVCVLAALLFCLTSGTVYLFNDIMDLEKDRAHPIKHKRPIPSGQLPVRVARVATIFIGTFALVCMYLIDWRLCLIALSYLILNVAYSLWLKKIPFLDVTIIATGFVFRVLAGAFAIHVFISEWLILCTFLLALYLGLGKRVHELKLVSSGQAKGVREVLARYNLESLQFITLFVAGLTIAAYTIYALTASLPNQPFHIQITPFSSPYLPGTIPFAIFGITRFFGLMHRDTLESPTELILRDLPFIINLLAWGLALFIIGFVFATSLSLSTPLVTP